MTSTDCNQSSSQDGEHHPTSTIPFDDNLQSKIDASLNNNKETSPIEASRNIPDSNSPTPPPLPPPPIPPKSEPERNYCNIYIYIT